jgi:hypothetical protein
MKSKLMMLVVLLAVAFSSTAMAELVINGGFQMYKPGTGFTITAAFDGVGYTGDIEGDVTLSSGVVAYSDGTAGNVINCPGWVESAPGVGLWIQGVADSLDTGNTSMETFSNWGPKDAEGNYVGTRIMSATSLGVINSDTVYTLSGMVKNGAVAGPLTLDLLADGVVITPSSDVTPTSDIGEFQEISRTYNPADLAGYAGQSIKIEFGTSFGNSVGGRGSWDNIVLDGEVVNENLPTVDAGENMITWTDETVTLNPIVTNNDTTVPQRALSYLWTVDPADGVVFADPVNSEDPNTSAALAPMVTITKPAGDIARVKLTLAVTLDGEGLISDSMTIDVFNDACATAIFVGAELDETDIDGEGDCVTNLADFAWLAATWLDDYTATGPITKD